MILEHVYITINADRVDDYLKAFARARPLVQGQPGCHSCQLLPAVDEVGNFLLLIDRSSKEDHTEGFRKSTAYQEWSRLLHPFYDVFPEVKYFTIPA